MSSCRRLCMALIFWLSSLIITFQDWSTLSCRDRYKSVNESAFVKVASLISAFFPQLNNTIPEQKKRIPETRILMVYFFAHEYGQGVKMLSCFLSICNVCMICDRKCKIRAQARGLLMVNNIEGTWNNLIQMMFH